MHNKKLLIPIVVVALAGLFVVATTIFAKTTNSISLTGPYLKLTAKDAEYSYYFKLKNKKVLKDGSYLHIKTNCLSTDGTNLFKFQLNEPSSKYWNLTKLTKSVLLSNLENPSKPRVYVRAPYVITQTDSVNDSDFTNPGMTGGIIAVPKCKSITATKSGIQGKVLDRIVCIKAPCDPVVYINSLVFVYGSDKKIAIKTAKPDAMGFYKLELPAGTYYIGASKDPCPDNESTDGSIVSCMAEPPEPDKENLVQAIVKNNDTANIDLFVN